MVADIIPVLAALVDMDAEEVDMEFGAAFAEAKAGYHGEANCRTFVEALLAFRAAHPFALGDLQVAQRAKEDVDARAASST